VLSKDGKIKIKQGRLNEKERISEEASGRERKKRWQIIATGEKLL